MLLSTDLAHFPGPPVPPPQKYSTSKQLTLLAFFAIVCALYFARDVLVPLTLAVMLSILLTPLVGMLRRLKLSRVPAVLVAVFLAIAVICAIGGLIGTQIANLAENVPTYAQTVESKVLQVRSYAGRELGRAASAIGYDGSGIFGAKPQPAPGPPKPSAQKQAGAAKPAPAAASPAPPGSAALPANSPAPIAVEMHQPAPSPIELAGRYLTPILSPLATAGIVFVVAIFILLQQDDLRDRIVRLFGSKDLRRTTAALDDGVRRISRYFLTQLGINTVFGIVIGVGLFAIGVPNPLLWGVLSGLLRFVPYVGSFISALFPLALAAAVSQGWSMILWTGGLYLVLEPITGQMIEPLLYGRSTGLSPISVVVAAIFWSWLWGPVGLILSTPLTLCLVVLGRHVDQLEFLDIMLGDQPALTAVESFYQRMLVGDPDEARDHAENLLKDRSLTAYYDEVALPGLELAAIDAQGGTLTPEQLDRIKETIKELVNDLAGHLDAPPPADAAGAAADAEYLKQRISGSWEGATPVLCVAGRGPLDEAAAEMLCQLLGKHGIGARIAPYAAATRGNINLLDTDGVAMVCVSYLDISGKQAHLRYLLQRLRQRLPETPIVVGLWPSNDPLPDRAARARLGADHFTRTIREAVEICAATAKDSGRTAPAERAPAA